MKRIRPKNMKSALKGMEASQVLEIANVGTIAVEVDSKKNNSGRVAGHRAGGVYIRKS
jgi:hypothetical protein